MPPKGARRPEPALSEAEVEALANWSPPRPLETRRGMRTVRDAEVTKALAACWDSPEGRDALTCHGVRLNERRGQRQARWWSAWQADAERVAGSRLGHDDAAGLPHPPGLSYLPYQAAGIRFCLAQRRALLADEMGLGKTVQALGVINAAEDVRRALVVCPSSLLANWVRETVRWRTDAAPVWRAKPGSIPPKGRITAFASYAMLSKLAPTVAKGEWDIVVFDEAHFLKSNTAQRTKAAKAFDAPRLLMLSGTPLLNRPVELWPLLQRLDPDTWQNWMAFTTRYCKRRIRRVPRWKKVNGVARKVGMRDVVDVSGAENLQELQERLRSSVMIRRLKSEVLPELPPKRRSVVLLGERGAERQSPDASIAVLSEALDSGGGLQSPEFIEIAKALRELGERKAENVGAAVAAMLEEVPKAVVFAHHRNVIETLMERLVEFKPVAVTGGTPHAARQKAVDRFQTEPTCRVFIGSIAAAGVGITLTAACDVVFAELPWRPADVSQAEDRCHRIGQADSVNVRHFVVPDTLDEWVAEVLVEKQASLDAALDSDGAAPVSVKRAKVRKGPQMDWLTSSEGNRAGQDVGRMARGAAEALLGAACKEWTLRDRLAAEHLMGVLASQLAAEHRVELGERLR